MPYFDGVLNISEMARSPVTVKSEPETANLVRLRLKSLRDAAEIDLVGILQHLVGITGFHSRKPSLEWLGDCVDFNDPLRTS